MNSTGLWELVRYNYESIKIINISVVKLSFGTKNVKKKCNSSQL